jgi:hypothetical protein
MKLIGQATLSSKTDTEVTNNSIFLDVADNKLKFKNNSGVIEVLKG